MLGYSCADVAGKDSAEPPAFQAQALYPGRVSESSDRVLGNPSPGIMALALRVGLLMVIQVIPTVQRGIGMLDDLGDSSLDQGRILEWLAVFGSFGACLSALAWFCGTSCRRRWNNGYQLVADSTHAMLILPDDTPLMEGDSVQYLTGGCKYDVLVRSIEPDGYGGGTLTFELPSWSSEKVVLHRTLEQISTRELHEAWPLLISNCNGFVGHKTDESKADPFEGQRNQVVLEEEEFRGLVERILLDLYRRSRIFNAPLESKYGMQEWVEEPMSEHNPAPGFVGPYGVHEQFIAAQEH
eukprot:s646_g12.t1